MSTNPKNKFASIWDDLDNMRAPKSRLAGIFDQIQTDDNREERLLTPNKKSNKKQNRKADKKIG